MSTVSIQARAHTAPQSRVRKGMLQPYDPALLAAVLAGLIVGLISGIHVLTPQPWMLPNIVTSLAVLLVSLLVLGALRLGRTRLHHGRLRPLVVRVALARHLGPRTIGLALRFAVAFELVALISTTLIQRLPQMRPMPGRPDLPRVMDASLWKAETWAHLGVEPGVWLASLPWPRGVLTGLDVVGVVWMIPVGFTVAWAISGTCPRRGARLLAGLLVLWVLCPLIAIALPTTGPFLVRQDLFPAPGMFLAHDMQQARFHHWVMHLFPHGDGAMIDGFGLMGFPSLPAAAVTLCVLYAWRSAWPLRIGVVALALLIGLSLLTAGWTYALSLYAGVTLAILVWCVTAWCIPQHARPRSRG